MDYKDDSAFSTLFTGMGRLEGKVDALTTMLETSQKSGVQLELRVRKLEQFRAWLLGIAFAGGAAGSALFETFFKHLI